MEGPLGRPAVKSTQKPIYEASKKLGMENLRIRCSEKERINLIFERTALYANYPVVAWLDSIRKIRTLLTFFTRKGFYRDNSHK